MKIKAKLDITEFENMIARIKAKTPKEAKKSVALMANEMQNRLTIALSVGGGGVIRKSKKTGKKYVSGGTPSTAPAPPHAQTGNLRKSISTEIFDGGYRRRVYVSAPYAIVHELGLTITRNNGITYDYPVRPFFMPSFKETLKNSTSILSTRFKAILK